MGDNIKMDLQEMGWGDMDWIALAQDRDMCQALLNAVMYLRLPYSMGSFLQAEDLLCFQEGLCSMELVIGLISFSSYVCQMSVC
jgi:hypothetical protein